VNESSRTNTTEAISALITSLESHEGTLTDRERQLCTTLLHGLAAAGQLRLRSTVPGDVVSDLPEYDYESATEGERWAFDQGYEDGWDDRLKSDQMDLDDVREVMGILVAALTRMADEHQGQKATRGRIEFADAVINLTEDPQR
jgi:hypothetical protein